MIPEKDVKIKYIGLRPGEKLKEELTTNDENVNKTKFEKIFVLKKRSIDEKNISIFMKQLRLVCQRYNEKQAKNMLKRFVLQTH